MLLTRDEFRKKVFERDNGKCVICKSHDSLAAHHIIERRLWDDFGYHIDNGATLCADHHLQAEQTVLSCEEIREAAGITKIILPGHLYTEYSYNKWGDIILPDGRRLRGELFFDESVQKILKSGNVLDLYCKYIKHPRIFHLPWSGKTTDDDKILQNIDHFKGKEVVISIKMDGEQISMYNNYIHARSIDGNSHPSQSLVKNLHSQIAYNIPEGWRICGENLYAKHNIHYKNLHSYFMVFSIWNENNICLSWEDTKEWAELLGLELVPVIYNNIFKKSIEKTWKLAKYNGDSVEGYVVRLADSFSYSDFKYSVAKFVSESFREGINHQYNWRYKPFKINKLAKE